MNMNGAFSRRILCTSAICTLMLGCIAAARGKSVEVEWGTGKFTMQCYSSTVNSSGKNTDLYWYRVYDGEKKLPYVRRYNGNVTYEGENPRSGVLNDDGSITLNADYSSNGKYKCIYRSESSFDDTLTTVRVVEPPLRVLECNSTSDANHSCQACQLMLPSDKETLTFTVIKAGRRGSIGSLVLVNASQLPVVSESHNTSRNDDDSTTIKAQYVLNASGLPSSMTLHAAFYETRYETEEECTVKFTKREPFVIVPTASTTSIVVPVVAGLVVIVLIVLFVLYKTNMLPLQRLRELRRRGNGGSLYIRRNDQNTSASAAEEHV